MTINCSNCQCEIPIGHKSQLSKELAVFFSENKIESRLCQKCQLHFWQQTISEFLQDLNNNKINSVKTIGKPEFLIKGIDYQINQNEAWVFSAWNLLRQGGCCGNGCRNCPYPSHMKKSKLTSISNY